MKNGLYGSKSYRSAVPAVKSRLHRARVFVRQELAGYFADQQKA